MFVTNVVPHMSLDNGLYLKRSALSQNFPLGPGTVSSGMDAVPN